MFWLWVGVILWFCSTLIASQNVTTCEQYTSCSHCLFVKDCIWNDSQSSCFQRSSSSLSTNDRLQYYEEECRVPLMTDCIYHSDSCQLCNALPYCSTLYGVTIPSYIAEIDSRISNRTSLCWFQQDFFSLYFYNFSILGKPKLLHVHPYSNTSFQITYTSFSHIQCLLSDQFVFLGIIGGATLFVMLFCAMSCCCGMAICIKCCTMCKQRNTKSYEITREETPISNQKDETTNLLSPSPAITSKYSSAAVSMDFDTQLVEKQNSQLNPNFSNTVLLQQQTQYQNLLQQLQQASTNSSPLQYISQPTQF